jgi:uncharacterized protein YjbI with pentapeptide repeats
MQNEDTTPDWIYNNIKDAAGQAEKLYFIYLGSILFVLISLSTIPDKALYLVNFPLKLPVVQSEVPVEIFIWFAPLLLVFIYIGLQVSLHKVAELSSKVKNIDHNKKEDRVFPFSLYNSLVYPETGIFGKIQTILSELTTFYSIIFVCLKAFCVTCKGREGFREISVYAITCFAFVLATYYQRRFRETSNSQYKMKYTDQINAFVWGILSFCPWFIWLLADDKFITDTWILYSSMIIISGGVGIVGFILYKVLRTKKFVSFKVLKTKRFIAYTGLKTKKFILQYPKTSLACFLLPVLILSFSFEKLEHCHWYPTSLHIEDIKSTDKFEYNRTLNWKGAELININMPYFGQKFGGQIILDHAIIYDKLWGDFIGASLKYADISKVNIRHLNIDQDTDLSYANFKQAKTEDIKTEDIEEEKKDNKVEFSMNYRANIGPWLDRIVNGINLSEVQLEGEDKNKFKKTIFVNSDLRSLNIDPFPDDFCQAHSFWNTEIDQKKLHEIEESCPKVLKPMSLDFFLKQDCENLKQDCENLKQDCENEANENDFHLCKEEGGELDMCNKNKLSQYFKDVYDFFNQDYINNKQIELIKTQIKNRNYFRGAYFTGLNLNRIVFKDSDLTFADFTNTKNITCKKVDFGYKLKQFFSSLYNSLVDLINNTVKKFRKDKKDKEKQFLRNILQEANLCEALSLYGSKNSNCSTVCLEKYEFPRCELALKVGDNFILVKDLIKDRDLNGLPLNVTRKQPNNDKCSSDNYKIYFTTITENICLAESLKNTQLSDDLKIFVTKYCPDKLK